MRRFWKVSALPFCAMSQTHYATRVRQVRDCDAGSPLLLVRMNGFPSTSSADPRLMGSISKDALPFEFVGAYMVVSHGSFKLGMCEARCGNFECSMSNKWAPCSPRVEQPGQIPSGGGGEGAVERGVLERAFRLGVGQGC